VTAAALDQNQILPKFIGQLVYFQVPHSRTVHPYSLALKWQSRSTLTGALPVSISIDEFQLRIARMYTAIGATVEEDVSHVDIQFKPQPGGALAADFRGGMSDAEIANLAWSAIHNIATFSAHCLKWARGNNISEDDVKAVADGSKALLRIRDLHNVEKHPDAAPNKSGDSPMLVDLCRPLEMIFGGSQPRVSLVLSQTGKVSVEGNARVVIHGRIINSKTGAFVTELRQLLDEGLKAWEAFLAANGVSTIAQGAV